MHLLTMDEVIHNIVTALGLDDKKPWDHKDLRVDYLKFKRDIFPVVLSVRHRAGTCIGMTVDDVETLLSLGEDRLRLSPEQWCEEFELCLKYRVEYDCRGLWDNDDLVLPIHSALVLVSEQQRHEFETHCKLDKVCVDEL